MKDLLEALSQRILSKSDGTSAILLYAIISLLVSLFFGNIEDAFNLMVYSSICAAAIFACCRTKKMPNTRTSLFALILFMGSVFFMKDQMDPWSQDMDFVFNALVSSLLFGVTEQCIEKIVKKESDLEGKNPKDWFLAGKILLGVLGLSTIFLIPGTSWLEFAEWRITPIRLFWENFKEPILFCILYVKYLDQAGSINYFGQWLRMNLEAIFSGLYQWLLVRFLASLWPIQEKIWCNHSLHLDFFEKLPEFKLYRYLHKPKILNGYTLLRCFAPEDIFLSKKCGSFCI